MRSRASDYQKKLFRYCVIRNTISCALNITIASVLLAILVLYLGLNVSTFKIGIFLIVALNLLSLAFCVKKITGVISNADCREKSGTAFPEITAIIKSVAKGALTQNVDPAFAEVGLIVILFNLGQRDALYAGLALMIASTLMFQVSVFLKRRKQARAEQ